MSKHGLTPEELAQFLDCLMQSFRNGFEARRRGKTSEQIMIHFDITAAGSLDLSPRLTRIHRRCVLNGINAFDDGIPLSPAEKIMRINLLREAYKLLKELNNGS